MWFLYNLETYNSKSANCVDFYNRKKYKNTKKINEKVVA